MTSERDELIRKFGLDSTFEPSLTRLGRGNVTVTLDRQLTAGSVEDRHTLLCICLGVRLGIDRLTCDYDFDRERGSDEDARNVYEIPSEYGERLQQLLPTAALDLAEAVGTFDVLRREWVRGANFELAYVREIGRHFHLLAATDIERLPYSEENVMEYARYALFYDAYRFRPHRVDRDDFGKTKWFRTSNGQAASRATLLPDLDYDSARAGGAFVLLDRNEFVVVEPTDERAALAHLREVARQSQREAPQPFSRRVYSLSTTSVKSGGAFDGAGEFDASSVARSVVDVSVK